MTVAGLNIRVNIWHYTFTDDEVGGADATGTVSHYGIWARLEQSEPESLLVQQGLEVGRYFTATAVPATLAVYERDEFEITEPKDHYYFGYRFRVTGVRPASNNPRDPRNYLILNLVRSDRAHSIQ